MANEQMTSLYLKMFSTQSCKRADTKSNNENSLGFQRVAIFTRFCVHTIKTLVGNMCVVFVLSRMCTVLARKLQRDLFNYNAVMYKYINACTSRYV